MSPIPSHFVWKCEAAEAALDGKSEANSVAESHALATPGQSQMPSAASFPKMAFR
eukprot:CAMPEP_0180799890 /NCGR_PEP_ID=MMETSP1038_2-20121128/58798_1 /TAXON_ID=632150 /ORGANISM="Azadinium spinosum, Strain 3D9" /LENGTH=54 /DNA_ID=CAMNT_0022839555 /DNA_START=42 /DNA_END=202 /DNA_ORIENTATION=+